MVKILWLKTRLDPVSFKENNGKAVDNDNSQWGALLTTLTGLFFLSHI